MAVDAEPGGELSESKPEAAEELSGLGDAADDIDAPGLVDATDDVGQADDGGESSEHDGSGSTRRWSSPLRQAVALGLSFVLTIGALAGWLGYRAQQDHTASAERGLYLQVAKQGALNLTTIDYQHADSDIQRILDSATGRFHAEFSQNAAPFVEVVKKAQSVSQGTVAEAGLESLDGDEARALVAVSVATTVAGNPEQQPRSWRMRLTLQKLGDEVKVSSVEFVA